MLSVDLSQAFDRVKLDRALSEHQVGSNLRSTITAIHEEAAYQVRDRYHATKITTTQGIRQGCRLAPALWAILSSQVLWDLTPAGSTPMQLPWTLFADDHLGHWTLRTIQDGGRMCKMESAEPRAPHSHEVRRLRDIIARLQCRVSRGHRPCKMDRINLNRRVFPFQAPAVLLPLK